MEVDASKGTLTIVGEVEPVPIFKKLKKIGKKPEIVSVGPPKPKCERWCSCSFCRPYVQCTPSHYSFVPSYPKQCELVAVTYPPPYDSEASSSGQCSIVWEDFCFNLLHENRIWSRLMYVHLNFISWCKECNDLILPYSDLSVSIRSIWGSPIL